MLYCLLNCKCIFHPPPPPRFVPYQRGVHFQCKSPKTVSEMHGDEQYKAQKTNLVIRKYPYICCFLFLSGVISFLRRDGALCCTNCDSVPALGHVTCLRAQWLELPCESDRRCHGTETTNTCWRGSDSTLCTRATSSAWTWRRS